MTDPPGDLTLTPLNGPKRTITQQLTTFHLLLLVLDPYTNESAWILPVAERVIRTFEQANCRVAILITCEPDDARRFLGPLARDVLTFVDAEREAVKAFGLDRLPAIVHVNMDGTVSASAQGWKPLEWRKVCERVAKVTRWTSPVVPLPRDPGPFEGSPALG